MKKFIAGIGIAGLSVLAGAAVYSLIKTRKKENKDKNTITNTEIKENTIDYVFEYNPAEPPYINFNTKYKNANEMDALGVGGWFPIAHINNQLDDILVDRFTEPDIVQLFIDYNVQPILVSAAWIYVKSAGKNIPKEDMRDFIEKFLVGYYTSVSTVIGNYKLIWTGVIC